MEEQVQLGQQLDFGKPPVAVKCTTTERPVPRNALSPAELETILAVCNSPGYAHLPPSQRATAG